MNSGSNTGWGCFLNLAYKALNQAALDPHYLWVSMISERLVYSDHRGNITCFPTIQSQLFLKIGAECAIKHLICIISLFVAMHILNERYNVPKQKPFSKC